MRACVQRVKRASVSVGHRIVGQIERGLLVLLGVGGQDQPRDAQYLADKISELRIFADREDRMNCSVGEVGGSVLVVSQFTLLGDCRKGRRPSFTSAAPPALAEALYQRFVTAVAARGIPVATGAFRAQMDVELVNDGPVTMLLDSQRQF